VRAGFKPFNEMHYIKVTQGLTDLKYGVVWDENNKRLIYS